MTEQNLSELESKILNCVDYSPHFMAVKPNQAIELIAYILASQEQPTPGQSDDEREVLDRWIDDNYFSIEHPNGDCDCVITTDDIRYFWQARTHFYKPQPTPSQSVDEKDTYIARLETLIYRIRNHDKRCVQHEWVENVLASKPAQLSKPPPTSQEVDA